MGGIIFKPFVFATPDGKKFHKHIVCKYNACCVVARVKTDFLGSLKFLVKEVLHPVPILKKFFRIGSFCYIDVVDKAESTYAARSDAQASIHPLRRGKREFPLMKHMLKGVDIQILVALVADKIMPIPFMVSHEEVLAVGRLDVLPVGKAILYREDGRMIVDLIVDSMLIQPGKRSLYLF